MPATPAHAERQDLLLEKSRRSALVRRRSADLVGDEDESVADCPAVHEAQRLLVVGLIEQSLAGSEYDREDDQPQFVDEIMREQRASESIARVDDDLSAKLLLEL